MSEYPPKKRIKQTKYLSNYGITENDDFKFVHGQVFCRGDFRGLGMDIRNSTIALVYVPFDTESKNAETEHLHITSDDEGETLTIDLWEIKVVRFKSKEDFRFEFDSDMVVEMKNSAFSMMHMDGYIKSYPYGSNTKSRSLSKITI